AHSMATVRRRAGVNVPWLLWSGLSGSPLPERASSPWFICTGGEVQVATSTENAMPAQWIAQSGVQERSQRLSYLLKAESLMQWLDLNVLAELNGPEAKCPPLAMAVGL
ncbi:OmpA family protein, partial [Salmonella enterica subsp. enterica serovar Enteritidis]|nr:OmpA family protein [Salmonella enterica subsp. enterica serovar Enteritidis]